MTHFNTVFTVVCCVFFFYKLKKWYLQVGKSSLVVHEWHKKSCNLYKMNLKSGINDYIDENNQ